MTKISVVSPVFEARDCLEDLVARLSVVLPDLADEYEIILVDDRSTDGSWQVIEKLASHDQRVLGIRLSRNFGQHYAITAGVDAADGDWIVVMDCDLQDPPERIADLYEEALKGSHVVLALFEQRGGSSVRARISQMFWRTLSWLAGVEFDPRVGNFRIMSRVVAENFKRYRERSRFLGGIVAQMGFTTSYVSLTRSPRAKGRSSYTPMKLASLAVDIIVAYSHKPLRISIVIGLIMSLLSFLIGGLAIVLHVFGVIIISGWTSLIVSIYLIGGMIIANLGVVGIYLGKVFDEVKQRPLYIVEQTTFEK